MTVPAMRRQLESSSHPPRLVAGQFLRRKEGHDHMIIHQMTVIRRNAQFSTTAENYYTE